jgi:hypothetical protein
MIGGAKTRRERMPKWNSILDIDKAADWDEM